jgi:hypothetical protein
MAALRGAELSNRRKLGIAPGVSAFAVPHWAPARAPAAKPARTGLPGPGFVAGGKRAAAWSRRESAWATLALLVARPAHAQKDMVGPDWLAMIGAFPKLVVLAAGEFALVLAPVLALLAVIAWVAARRSDRTRDRNPGTSILVVLAVVAAALAMAYLALAPAEPSNPFKSYRSTSTRDATVAPLAPPGGKSWPASTGYLDMRQVAQGGHGVITVRAGSHGIYVKLCEAGTQPCPGLRHAFVQERSVFAFRDLPAGTYEIRYLPIRRPTIGGRSQPIRISGYVEDEHVVTAVDSPVLDSRHPVVGIHPKDF